MEEQESTGSDATNYCIERTRSEYTASLSGSIFISSLLFADQIYVAPYYISAGWKCAVLAPPVIRFTGKICRFTETDLHRKYPDSVSGDCVRVDCVSFLQ